MLGRTHALTGWCAGLAIAPTVGLDTIPPVLVFAATVAGFALLPDLDHPGARASRLLGPVTGSISWLLRRASAALYSVTKGPRDEDCEGTHRHLSHTVLFAGVLGGLTAWGGAVWGHWFVLAGVVFGILLAADALGDWVLPIATIAGLLMVGRGDGLAALDGIGGWIGIAVTAGCVVHICGDLVTISGVPALFPIPIAGETWAEIKLPRGLRLRTGSTFETRWVFGFFALLGVLLIPGAWGIVADIIGGLIHRNNA